jgi:hypothetical protein
MDNLRTGEKIAGASGVALILIMFIFDWFSVEGTGGLGGLNAWQSFGVIDLVLLLAAAAAITLAVVAATQSQVDMPVALSAITAGLGGLALLLVIFRIISPPEFDVFGEGFEIETDRDIGVFLGLIATAGIAYGGWTAMQEEGTSFTGEADRAGDRGDDAPPPPPPPPPPSGGCWLGGAQSGVAARGVPAQSGLGSPPPPPPPPGGPSSAKAPAAPNRDKALAANTTVSLRLRVSGMS